MCDTYTVRGLQPIQVRVVLKYNISNFSREILLHTRVRVTARSTTSLSDQKVHEALVEYKKVFSEKHLNEQKHFISYELFYKKMFNIASEEKFEYLCAIPYAMPAGNHTAWSASYRRSFIDSKVSR